MNPSDLRIRAISTLSFDEGSSTRSWCDWIPFRIRVNISATGSVIDILDSSISPASRVLGPGSVCLHAGHSTQDAGPVVLPARLRHARDISPQRELPKTDSAKLELAQVAARAPANLAAILRPTHELGLALRFDDHRRFCHLVLVIARRASRARAEGRAPARRFSPW